MVKQMEKYEIDAAGKSLGRVASEAAVVLRGKHKASYTRNKAGEVSVHIINAGRISILPGKPRKTAYTRYSGYPGGLKSQTMEEMAKKHGYREVLRKMIRGMIPTNRLRPIVLKNLTISE
jgi:large subunit ribosomal protein L13